jgi:hypothetical protein
MSAQETGADEKYTMTVDLSVLESLGINLYSNAAAVLSELVANAYDADSNVVTIGWKQHGEQVIVTDDGTGMDVAALNERFLKAGYKKRTNEGVKSLRFDRPFMGRKGIGKLSVFSIAKTIEVYSTTETGESNGLRIEVAALQSAIEEGRPYHPDDIPVPAEHAEKGTTLVLSDLKTKRAALTASALRKRLARRFDVLDTRSPEEGGFAIVVNDKPITYADRQELKRLEFIWEFGEKTLSDEVLPSGVTRFVLPSNVVDGKNGWHVGGWFGTARKPTDLTDDEEAGSLKNIIVLARKRPIQEGIIEKLDFSRIFGNYVTGQIEADFLDLDDEGYDDIATSDRQRLIEDDDRVIALQKFLREAFLRAADQWSKARPKKEAVDVLARYPKLRDWVDSRPPYQREAAEKMIGTVASLELERKSEEDRKDLFRSGVLAFERIGLRQVLQELEDLSEVRAEQLLPLLGIADAFESALWVDILRARVQAISTFRNLTNTDEKEKVLQAHLFDHLWLLDASWERAVTSPTMEEDLRRIDPGTFPKDNSGEELKGRIDIRYARMSGQHVIVELKRYGVKSDVRDLTDQGLKYFSALNSVLEQQGKPGAQIEVVFVLGHKPGAAQRGRLSPDEYIANTLIPINGRYVLYDELIANAKNQYEAYLNASDKAQELEELLKTFDDGVE